METCPACTAWYNLPAMALQPAHRATDPDTLQQTVDALCDALRAGRTRTAAAAAAGISRPSLYRWCAEGVLTQDNLDAIARAEMEARGEVEELAHTKAIDAETPLRDVLTYLARAPSSKADWSEMTVQAIVRALPREELLAMLGAGDDDAWPTAQEVLALPAPPQEESNGTE